MQPARRRLSSVRVFASALKREPMQAALVLTRSLQGLDANCGLETYERNFRRSHERSLRLGHYVNRRLATFYDAEWDEKLDPPSSGSGPRFAEDPSIRLLSADDGHASHRKPATLAYSRPIRRTSRWRSTRLTPSELGRSRSRPTWVSRVTRSSLRVAARLGMQTAAERRPTRAQKPPYVPTRSAAAYGARESRSSTCFAGFAVDIPAARSASAQACRSLSFALRSAS